MEAMRRTVDAGRYRSGSIAGRHCLNPSDGPFECASFILDP